MAREDPTREDVTPDEKDVTPDEKERPGDVLGISHLPAGGAGEIQPARGSSGTEDEGRITPLDDEGDLGARDVTKSSHGETGPATGGHGSTPQRSGATGTDIGS